MIWVLVLIKLFSVILCDSKANKYRTEWFRNMDIDHFGYLENGTFSLKYLINDTYFKEGGPIFFYCGNEGEVEKVANTTGFLWDNANSFNALILLAEHRYYGKSLPFGNESYSHLDHIQYLTIEQTLLDFVTLIRWIKQTYAGASNSPVIAFGGSYGGILAAFLRIKYPYIVQGSIASSAPIAQFIGKTDCGLYALTATKAAKHYGVNCAESLKSAMAAIRRLLKTTAGQNKLMEILHFCPEIEFNRTSTAKDLQRWFYFVFVYSAQYNYPFAANNLKPLPAWPLKEVCKHLTNPNASDEVLIGDMHKAISVYLNYTGQQPCYKYVEVLPHGSYGWTFQTCTQMLMPLCQTEESMFEKSEWNLTDYSGKCYKRYGVRPDKDWIQVEYGVDKLQTSSNIVFSNGDMDPWSGLGVLKNVSDSVISLVIKDGAHHYDLCGQNENDTQWVKDIRQIEINQIKMWIAQYHEKL